MNPLLKALLVGLAAGAVNIAVYALTTRHIFILVAYAVLMLAMVFVLRSRVASFRSRALAALVAFLTATLVLWVYEVSTFSGHIPARGAAEGLAKALAIGVGASVVVSLLSWRSRVTA